MMTKQEIEEMVRGLNDPELSKKHGHVAMIFSDGECASQKGGELLWQRNLHCLEPGIPGAEALELVFPNVHGPFTFAWVTPKQAYDVRASIKELLGIETPDRLRGLMSYVTEPT